MLLLLSSCSEDDIVPIQKQCKEVNDHIKDYRHKTLDLAANSESADEISGYFKGKTMIKGVIESANENGRNYEEYYYDGEDLSCVKKIAFVYNKPLYYDQATAQKNGDSIWHDDKKTIIKTCIFYFYDKRMIKWIDENNNPVPDNDRRYTLTRLVLLRDAEKLQKMFNDQ